MYIAGYIVAGFIVAGVYASAWLKGRRDRYHRTGLVVALSFAALAAPVQVLVGDWAGRQVADSQRSEEHTSELQSRQYLVCRLLLEKKNKYTPAVAHVAL